MTVPGADGFTAVDAFALAASGVCPHDCHMSLVQRLLALAVIATLAGSDDLAAQSATPDFRQAAVQLKDRDTLRIWALHPYLDRRRVILESVRGDTLRVIPASGVIDEIRFAAIPAAHLTRIDLFVPSGGRRHPVRSGLTGMLIGALVGAGTFAAAAEVITPNHPRSDSGLAVVGGAALGFLTGGITGTIIGVQMDARKAGTWRTVLDR